MDEELTVDKNIEKSNNLEDEVDPLKSLEEKVGYLLMKYQELLEERDGLAVQLAMEKEMRAQMEKKLELLSEDREKVKTRIDQLLSRLKNIDI